MQIPSKTIPVNVASTSAKKKSWRDVLPIHPAAEMFERPAPEQLRELADDIKKNGLLVPITLWSPGYSGDGVKDHKTFVLDGISRLDALELLGRLLLNDKGELDNCRYDRRREYTQQGSFGLGGSALKQTIVPDTNPYEYVVSANIHRRHLTPEQKREVIAKLLEATPNKSDREIAKLVKRDHKTVAAVRKQAEDVGRIPHVAKRTDSKGRQQPATRARRGERHVCWQCRARDEVGKVEKHHYAEYEEDCDVWLHPACVADFEKSLAADRKAAADQPTDVEASANARKAAAAIEEASGAGAAPPVPDVQPTAAKPKLDPLPSLPSLRELRALRASASKETDPLKPAKDAMAALCWLVLAASDPRLVEHLPTVVAEKLGVSAANDIDRVIALLTDVASRLRAKEVTNCVVADQAVERAMPPPLAPIQDDEGPIPAFLDRAHKLH